MSESTCVTIAILYDSRCYLNDLSIEHLICCVSKKSAQGSCYTKRICPSTCNSCTVCMLRNHHLHNRNCRKTKQTNAYLPLHALPFTSAAGNSKCLGTALHAMV